MCPSPICAEVAHLEDDWIAGALFSLVRQSTDVPLGKCAVRKEDLGSSGRSLQCDRVHLVYVLLQLLPLCLPAAMG